MIPFFWVMTLHQWVIGSQYFKVMLHPPWKVLQGPTSPRK